MKVIKLICALGNHEVQYMPTRHNAGVWWIDSAVKTLGLKWQQSPKNFGTMAKEPMTGVIFFKPASFMNINGENIAKMAHYYKIASENILIAYDDMDFEPGIIKLRNQGASGGHNGVKSVIAHFSESNFYRLRIGIGRKTKYDIADYVLAKPKQEEKEAIDAAIAESMKKINLLLKEPKAFQEYLALWNKTWQKKQSSNLNKEGETNSGT